MSHSLPHTKTSASPNEVCCPAADASTANSAPSPSGDREGKLMESGKEEKKGQLSFHVYCLSHIFGSEMSLIQHILHH